MSDLMYQSVLLDEKTLFGIDSYEWSQITDYSMSKMVRGNDKSGVIVKMTSDEIFGIPADSGLSMTVKSGSVIDIDTNVIFNQDEIIVLNGHDAIFKPLGEDVYLLFTH